MELSSIKPNWSYTKTSACLSVNVCGVQYVDGNVTFYEIHKHWPCKILLNFPVPVLKHYLKILARSTLTLFTLHTF